MKKVLVICIVALIASVSAFAGSDAPQRGNRGNGDKDSQKRIEKMCKDLNLNEEQTKQFQQVNKDFMEKMKAQREASDTDRQKRREAMQAMQTERNAQIKKILTDEQYKKYTEMQKNMRKNMRKGDRPNRQ